MSPATTCGSIACGPTAQSSMVPANVGAAASAAATCGIIALTATTLALTATTSTLTATALTATACLATALEGQQIEHSTHAIRADRHGETTYRREQTRRTAEVGDRYLD